MFDSRAVTEAVFSDKTLLVIFIFFCPTGVEVVAMLPPFRWMMNKIFGLGQHIKPSIAKPRWQERLWGSWAHPISQLLIDISLFGMALFIVLRVTPADISASELRSLVVRLMGIYVFIYSSALGMLIVFVQIANFSFPAYGVAELVFAVLRTAFAIIFFVAAGGYEVDPSTLCALGAVIVKRELGYMGPNVVKGTVAFCTFMRHLIAVPVSAELRQRLVNMQSQLSNPRTGKTRIKNFCRVVGRGVNCLNLDHAESTQIYLSKWESAAQLTDRIRNFAVADWERLTECRGDLYYATRNSLSRHCAVPLQPKAQPPERVAFDHVSQAVLQDSIAFGQLAQALRRDIPPRADDLWHDKFDALCWLGQQLDASMTAGAPQCRHIVDHETPDHARPSSDLQSVTPVSARILADISSIAFDLHKICEGHLDSIAVELIEVMLLLHQTEEFNHPLQRFSDLMKHTGRVVAVPPGVIPALQVIVGSDVTECQAFSLRSLIEGWNSSEPLPDIALRALRKAVGANRDIGTNRP